jgi:hypothetical protein
MTVVGKTTVVFDRQQNVFVVNSQLESARFKAGQHFEWTWHHDRYAARFRDQRHVTAFLIQQKEYHGKTQTR